MNRDQTIGLVLILFAVFMYYQATLLPPPMFGALGADVFPKLLFFLLALFGGTLFVQATIKARRRPAAAEGGAGGAGAQTADGVKKAIAHYRYVIVGFAFFCLYVVLMYYLGYMIATLIFMPAFMWILGPRSKKSLLIITVVSLGLTFGMQYGFAHVLKVFLPSGTLF